jgi:hypothetical protein
LSNDELLRIIPEDVKVMNCAYCGRLMARKYRREGLRIFGGNRKMSFYSERLYRPLCLECFADAPLSLHEPLYGRTPAQAQSLKRLWRDSVQFEVELN